MHQGKEFAYAETDAVQVVELPYRGSDFAMVIVLPRKADGLDAVEKSLTGEAFDGWVAELAPRDVVLSLPKFRSEASMDLARSLAGLGMKAAFTQSADFTGIAADDPIWVSSVVHRAVVKVDEEGTEAAAATASTSWLPRQPKPKPPVEFKADHPFLYVIRDVESGAILFLGHVVDPTR